MKERTAPVTEQEGHEYELVLGNRQLLSILFLVVVLFGVFFAMGYVMGRNSAPVETAAKGAAEREEVIPSQVRQGGSDDDENEPVQIQTDNNTEKAAPEQQSGASPAAAQANATPEPVLDGPPLVTEPQAGQRFLQVSAVAKPEAELLVEVLTRKKFRAVIAPGPNDRLFRVLVGPVRDDDESVKTRVELEAAGFKPIPRQY